MQKHQTFLFVSKKAIHCLLFLVLVSQLTNTVVSALNFSDEYVLVTSQESEKPKQNESKNAFDFEEVKYILKAHSTVAFFSDEETNIFDLDESFFEVIHTLDSPPPEVA